MTSIFTNPKNSNDYVNSNNTIPVTKEAVSVSGGRVQASRVGAKRTNLSRISPFNRVITSARKLYARQLDKNASMKNRSIEQSASMLHHNPDKFWEEFDAKKADILDSRRFEKFCVDEGLNPEIAAEHLLLEKASVIKDVLQNGFGSLKGAQKGFIEPISRRTYKVERAETPKEPIINRGLQIPAHSESLANPINALVDKSA